MNCMVCLWPVGRVSLGSLETRKKGGLFLNFEFVYRERCAEFDFNWKGWDRGWGVEFGVV